MNTKHIYIEWKLDKFIDHLSNRNIIGHCADFLKSIYVQMQIYSKVIIESTVVKEYGNVCTYGPLIDIRSTENDCVEYVCGINELEIRYVIDSIIEVGLDFYLNNKYMTNDDMSKYVYIMRGNIKYKNDC